MLLALPVSLTKSGKQPTTGSSEKTGQWFGRYIAWFARFPKIIKIRGRFPNWQKLSGVRQLPTIPMDFSRAEFVLRQILAGWMPDRDNAERRYVRR